MRRKENVSTLPLIDTVEHHCYALQMTRQLENRKYYFPMNVCSEELELRRAMDGHVGFGEREDLGGVAEIVAGVAVRVFVGQPVEIFL